MSPSPAALAKLENARLLREDVARRATVMRARPEVIGLYTTEKCNLRCTMCPRSLGQGERQLPRERLAAICDQLFPAARKAALSAAGGDPLVADFDLVLEKALQHEVRVDVVTNGTMLTREIYARGAPVFDHVNVSIDSSVPEVYEKIRVGSKFERLEANLRGIFEERRRHPDGVLFSLSAVVMRSTMPHLEALIRYARDLGVDGLILQRLNHEVKRTWEEDPFLDLGEAAVGALLSRLRIAAREAGLNLFVSDFREPNEIVSPPRAKVPQELLGQGACWYLLQHFGVQPTGEVYPCCYPTDYRLGDLLCEEPLEIWNSPVAQSLRAAHYARHGTLFCSGCVHAPHLPAKRPARLVAWLRRRRLAASHRRSERREHT